MDNGYKLKDASEEVSIPTYSGGMVKKTEYQEVEFDTDMIPEIANWKVGEKYKLVIEVMMTASELDDDVDTGAEDDAPNTLVGSFDIYQVGAYNEVVDQYGSVVKEKLKLG